MIEIVEIKSSENIQLENKIENWFIKTGEKNNSGNV